MQMKMVITVVIEDYSLLDDTGVLPENLRQSRNAEETIPDSIPSHLIDLYKKSSAGLNAEEK